jgi:hypothetical protein
MKPFYFDIYHFSNREIWLRSFDKKFINIINNKKICVFLSSAENTSILRKIDKQYDHLFYISNFIHPKIL